MWQDPNSGGRGPPFKIAAGEIRPGRFGSQGRGGVAMGERRADATKCGNFHVSREGPPMWRAGGDAAPTDAAIPEISPAAILNPLDTVGPSCAWAVWQDPKSGARGPPRLRLPQESVGP